MQIVVNGKDTDVPQGATVLDLITEHGLDPDVVVVERNLDIVPGDAFADTALIAGDRIELLQFVGGG